MRGTFSARQTFAVAAGVGLAVALAPMGVDAAKRTARAIAVDKKGRAKVVVANRPSVKVPGGVAVTNEPTVKVPGGVAVTNRPTVEIGNQPSVTVANQPSEMSVTAPAGKLTATTRPPLDDVFNVGHFDLDDLNPREIVRVSGSERAAVTHVLVGVRDFGSPVGAPTIADVVRYERVSGSNPCGQAGWTGTTLRRVTLQTDSSLALDLGSAPFVVRAQEGGEPRCIAVKLYQWVGDTRVDVGADGYRF